jgi:hypothetical protein
MRYRTCGVLRDGFKMRSSRLSHHSRPSALPDVPPPMRIIPVGRPWDNGSTVIPLHTPIASMRDGATRDVLSLRHERCGRVVSSFPAP